MPLNVRGAEHTTRYAGRRKKRQAVRGFLDGNSHPGVGFAIPRRLDPNAQAARHRDRSQGAEWSRFGEPHDLNRARRFSPCSSSVGQSPGFGKNLAALEDRSTLEAQVLMRVSGMNEIALRDREGSARCRRSGTKHRPREPPGGHRGRIKGRLRRQAARPLETSAPHSLRSSAAPRSGRTPPGDRAPRYVACGYGFVYNAVRGSTRPCSETAGSAIPRLDTSRGDDRRGFSEASRGWARVPTGDPPPGTTDGMGHVWPKSATPSPGA